MRRKIPEGVHMNRSGEPFNVLANELQDFTIAAVTKAQLNAPDLRRVLRFIVKVSQIAGDAIDDIIGLLIEIKYLTPQDVNPSKIRDLQKQIDLLTMRSRYRDVEEICSR